MGQWLTPDSSGGAYLCRRFQFRAELADYITGVLQGLTVAGKWEEFGNLSPDEIALMALDAFNSWCDSGDTCMVGQLWMGVTAVIPDDVLEFDGVQRARVDYPALYAVLDAAFIDDADNFTLHEAAGRALVAAGSGTGLTPRTVGDRFGSETHTLDISEMPTHNHTYDKAVAAESIVLGELPGVELGAYSTELTGDTGDGGAHNNLQPSFAVKIGVWAK